MPYIWQAPKGSQPISWRSIFRGRSCSSCGVLKKRVVLDPTDENGVSSAYPQRTLISTPQGFPEPTIGTIISQVDSLHGIANLEPVLNTGNASAHGAGHHEACGILQGGVREGGYKTSAGPTESGRKPCSVEDTPRQDGGGIACNQGQRACAVTNQSIPRGRVPSLSEKDTDGGVRAGERVKRGKSSTGAAQRIWSFLTSAFRKPTTRRRGRARCLRFTSQRRRKPRKKARGKRKRGSNAAAAVGGKRRTDWGVVGPLKRLISGRGSPSREKLRERPSAGSHAALSSGVPPDGARVAGADSATERCARPTPQRPSDGAEGMASATRPRTFLGRLFARRAKPFPGSADAGRRSPAGAPASPSAFRRWSTRRCLGVLGDPREPSTEMQENNLQLVEADEQVDEGGRELTPFSGEEGASRPRSGHDECIEGLDLASLLRSVLGDGPYPSLPKAMVTSKAICEAKECKRLWKKMRKMQNSGVGMLDFYKLGGVLGRGSFAEVRIGHHKLTGSRVAIKRFFGKQLKDKDRDENIFREIKILNKLHHPQILRLYEVVEGPDGLYLVTEYLGGGNLCEYIEDKGYLSHSEARGIFRQLLEGVEHIHNSGIVHRDIKPENIMLDGRQPVSVKLVDFGIGREVTQERIREFSGTPEYHPPEVVQSLPHLGEPVDVWCLGIVLFVMLCGRLPFFGSELEEVSSKIVCGSFRISMRVSGNAADLIRGILEKDPTLRMGINLILEHPWMNEVLVESPSVGAVGPSSPSVGLSRGVSKSARRILERSVHHSELSPEDNVCISTLRLMESCGVDGDELICQILRQQRSSLTTTFHLLQQELEEDLLGDWREVEGSSSDGTVPEPRGRSTAGDRPVWDDGQRYGQFSRSE